MVIDTSALLAMFFNEARGSKVAEIMEANAADLRMSTVNLAETLILLEDRQPQCFENIRKEILESSIRFVAPSIQQAQLAAKARLDYPLNLGDCFAYALAKVEQDAVLTLDPDFHKTDIEVVKL
ncbi:MAG: type II toxin-antitoxin system VapC family toxin [Deltaproteobacteria bacterium]|nr:type II toxin-antitoxin system VapC family toxin [Deltaproteobacteria bacterium]